MPRRRATDAQLDLEWTDTMRWEDLPVAVRERVCERLADVLHQVARNRVGVGRSGVMHSDKIRPEHLQRPAFIYVRQSSLAQVRPHQEGWRRQYDLQGHARALGWAQVVVIDEDLGKSGTSAAERAGFQRLVAEVSLGRVGACSVSMCHGSHGTIATGTNCSISAG